ncbi:MAG: lysine-2,3-aminomutase-like protein [Alphaproteobacteria bacterium]|nr:lysine-2,3-aminomutase-like protein [Alphaproteobacteria bacterium]
MVRNLHEPVAASSLSGRPSAPHRSEKHYVKLKGGDTNPALLKKYACRITQNIKRAIKGNIHNDPIAKQYLPQACELKILPEERTDPIGDEAHSPVKGIVHRYPDRVLFKPANVCAVYCRYCFRREQVGPKNDHPPGILNAKERTAALNYIRAHPEIWEVILTGGDPLILSPRQLGEIMDALQAIDHVKVIRIHTRVPIADPERLRPALIAALTGANTRHTDQSVCRHDKALYMALHINHAQELTPEVRSAIKTLHRCGISLLSQSVLLKGINNDAAILTNLYRELVALHVKPYYLHHPDLAPGTSHFRLSIKEGQSIMRALRGHLSGLCQPTYMLDIPGGYGKVPLTPCTLEPLPAGGYNVTDYKDEQHIYAPQSESQKP